MSAISGKAKTPSQDEFFPLLTHSGHLSASATEFQRYHLHIGQVFLGLSQNGCGQFRVCHDPRNCNRPNHRRHRDQRPLRRSFMVRPSIMLGENIHKREKSGGCGSPRLVVAPRQLASEPSQDATLRQIVSVILRKVLRQDCFESSLIKARAPRGPVLLPSFSPLLRRTLQRPVGPLKQNAGRIRRGSNRRPPSPR